MGSRPIRSTSAADEGRSVYQAAANARARTATRCCTGASFLAVHVAMLSGRHNDRAGVRGRGNRAGPSMD